MRHHLLTNYMHAILSVVLAQFSGLGFLDGMEGVVKLAEASPYVKVSASPRLKPAPPSAPPPSGFLNGVEGVAV